jgi:hypothetical protein
VIPNTNYYTCRALNFPPTLQLPNNHYSDDTFKNPLAPSNKAEKEKGQTLFTRRFPNWRGGIDTFKNLFAPSNKTEKEGRHNFFTRRLSGWRGGIALNATLAGAVLLVNVVILATAKAKYTFKDGLATIHASCETAKAVSLTAHVLINILSTLLLGASNYAMQVASSPTRADIDRAHRRQKTLDIGVLSIRNFRWVSRWRLAAYMLLLLSSIPLHFVYVLIWHIFISISNAVLVTNIIIGTIP